MKKAIVCSAIGLALALTIVGCSNTQQAESNTSQSVNKQQLQQYDAETFF